ncbi:membrane-binding protein [Chryseobacterium sp.]|uniref:membrane-binding protein n=1 Tax=Chryseobacterium sp. TaxID=1871047 RepID=UPI0025B8A374|nr:membrane-binding protein [Chryseobacterium sp.]MBV8325459.1 membrane-binding protein [Chryseobacterium sp.]
MKKLFTSALLALVLSVSVYAQERTYFDENWEKTSKDKMEYYRETSAKGKLTLIKDYYKNGTLQMEGLASDTTPSNEIFDGKVTWYTPEGKVMSSTTYSNGKHLGPSQSYDAKGRLIEEMTYKADDVFSGKIYSYKDPENEYFYNSITTYENSLPSRTLIYDEDIKGIRYESTFGKDSSYETKYYGEKGKFIGAGNSGSGENLLVDYYYNPMRVSKIEKYKSDGTIKEGVIYTKSGKVLQEQKRNKKDGYKTTYDESGKKIANLIYQYDKENDSYKPIEGEDYQFSYDNTQISSIDVYKNGSVILNKSFDDNGKLVSEKTMKDDSPLEIKFYSPDGKLKSTLTYKDDMPYNGTSYEGLNEIQYKDGISISTKNYSEDQKLISEKKLNTKQNTYEGTIYNSKGAIVYTFTQPVKEEEDNSYNFTGNIVQYIKGKAGNKAVVKNGALQSGKIRLTTTSGTKELERNGKWILLKVYNADGKLIQDSKILADTGDEFASADGQTVIQEDDLYNGFE